MVDTYTKSHTCQNLFSLLKDLYVSAGISARPRETLILDNPYFVLKDKLLSIKIKWAPIEQNQCREFISQPQLVKKLVWN